MPATRPGCVYIQTHRFRRQKSITRETTQRSVWVPQPSASPGKSCRVDWPKAVVWLVWFCWFVWLVGLGWVGLGWVGLGWVGLGWVGLCWVVLGWVGLGWVGLGWLKALPWLPFEGEHFFRSLAVKWLENSTTLSTISKDVECFQTTTMGAGKKQNGPKEEKEKGRHEVSQGSQKETTHFGVQPFKKRANHVSHFGI